MKKEVPERDFEYYCSFNVAMLLKEKGFNAYCDHVWQIDDGQKPSLSIWGKEGCYYVTNNELDSDELYEGKYIAAPTISYINDYLRRRHFHYVTTEPYVTTEGIMYLYKVWKLDHKNLIFNKVKEVTGFDTPHEAELNGIKFIFEKIIH